LLREVRDHLGLPVTQHVRRSREKAGIEERGHVLRPDRTVRDASDGLLHFDERFEREQPVRRDLVVLDAEPALRVRGERIAPHRLARLRLADRDDVPTGRLGTKMVVERDDAVDLGTREVEPALHVRDRRERDVSERLLHGVEHRHQRRFETRERGDDAVYHGTTLGIQLLRVERRSAALLERRKFSATNVGVRETACHSEILRVNRRDYNADATMTS
jgi:hypothetical protein